MDERDSVNDAFWLPALEPRDHDGFEERSFGSWTARVPRLHEAGVRRLAGELVAARERVLADRPVATLIAAAAAAAETMTRPGGPIRAALERHLPEITGYAPEMIRMGLDRMARDWSPAALRKALAAELGDPEILDRPRPHPLGARARVRAFGPRVVAHIFAGNVPGVSVTSLLRALLVKAASFGKSASGEPLTAVAFARALAATDEELARCIAVAYWPGGSEDLEAALFESADAVIAYGGDASVESVRARVPRRTPLIVHPHKVGVALVGRDALRSDAETIAEAAARDVAVFDQQGCVAPHAVYVEAEPDEVARFAERIAAALARIAVEWPRGRISAAEAARIHDVRARMEFAGARVWASPEGTAWTVVLEPHSGFTPSPLNRFVYVRPVPDLDSALAALEPVRTRLQSVGLAADATRFDTIAVRLGELGASRVVPLGEMSWPEPESHPDGRFQFLDLLRFVDLRP